MCVYIAFKIQRKALLCLELHSTPFIYGALAESLISRILFPITVHPKQDGKTEAVFTPVLKTLDNVLLKRLNLSIKNRYSKVLCKVFLDNGY